MANDTQQEALRKLIADDAYAASFQSMGQYRKALLAATAEPHCNDCGQPTVPDLVHTCSPQVRAELERPVACKHEWVRREEGQPWLACERCGVDYGDHASPQVREQPPAHSPAEILKAREQGRAEAFEIINELGPENLPVHSTGEYGEYTEHFDEARLKELLHVADEAYSLIDKYGAMYWRALGERDEARRELEQVREQPAIPEWISVEDRLPPIETDVLVRVLRNGFEEGFDVAGMFHGEWASFATESETKGDVTHWMPLPAAPSPENKQ